MKRLTSDKNTSDMSMLELAYNSSYINHENDARFRNYDLDIDSRQFVRELAKDMCNEDFSNLSDEEFDEYMASMLSVEIDSTIGLLAVFYRNLWAMADLRERLKEYEDSEEQGRLIKLPCNVGDTVYYFSGGYYKNIKNWEIVPIKVTEFNVKVNRSDKLIPLAMIANGTRYPMSSIGKTVFLTKTEAEAKLKELRGNNE